MTQPVALDDVAVFLAVAECESFVGAARRLGIPQSSVSRRVAALESQVGKTLLRRTTRSLSLTSEGQRLVQACAPAVAQVRAALDDIATAPSGASASLSIAISPYICPDQFRAWVSDFGAERPDIQLNLTVNGNHADFVEDGIDLAIQMGRPRQENLVSVKLYDVPFRLVVSRDLLRQKPELRNLKHPRQLLEYVCSIILPMPSWSFVSRDGEEVQVTPSKLAASANDPWVVVNAVSLGRGVAFLPEALLDDRLVPIDIVGWTPVASSVHAVYPQRLRNTDKVRSALESVRRRGNIDRTREPSMAPTEDAPEALLAEQH